MSSQWSGVHCPAKLAPEYARSFRASTSTQALAWGHRRQSGIKAEGDVEYKSAVDGPSKWHMPQPLKEQACSPFHAPTFATSFCFGCSTPGTSASHIPTSSGLMCGHDCDDSSERESLPPPASSKESVLSSGRLVIKNTFYEVEEDSDLDAEVQPGLTKWFSAPLPRLASGGLQDAETDGPEATSGNSPSIGSSDHGTGNCRPCAWFWKSSGCQNGRECRHCHLCPEDEIKSRRRAKYMKKKAEKREKQMFQQMDELHGHRYLVFASSDTD